MLDYTLRPWRKDDLESLVTYANNFNISSKLTDKFPHPYTSENGKAFIEMSMSILPTLIFAIDINGKACGGIGLHPKTDVDRLNAELGYWLAEPFWGQGIITAAIKEIVKYGFDNFEFTRIFARPFGNNIASQKVLQKAGFTLEASFEKTLIKNGELLDELIYAIRKNPLV